MTREARLDSCMLFAWTCGKHRSADLGRYVRQEMQQVGIGFALKSFGLTERGIRHENLTDGWSLFG